MNNPWRVDSIQEFSCLKCPECDYFNKKESYFKDHAISNHPLSSVLFDKTKPKSESEVAVKVEMPDCVNHVTVEDIKKEPSDLDSFAKDPLDFCGTNTHQEEHCMSLKTGNELPNDKDVSNPKLKPVKQKRKQSHLEIRNDCDEFVAFDNEDKVPRITENQSKKRKRKQIIAARNEFALDEDIQGPVSIKSDSFENKQIACTLCDYKTDDRVKFRNHLGSHFSCNNCGKKFHGKNGRQEMKIHWEFQICEKAPEITI